MNKIEKFNDLKDEDKFFVLALAYEKVCKKLQDIFIFDYSLDVIKDFYINKAIEFLALDNIKN